MSGDRICWLCGRNGSADPLDCHHIFGGANRKKSDKLGLVVDLCHYCHNEPPNGVHHNRQAMLELRQYGQKKAMQEQGWTKEEFIKQFGRNYL